MVLMYLSNGCSFSQVVQDLSCLLVPNFTTIIIGDLNFDKKDKNDLTSFLSKKKFSQQVSWPTHIQGRTLDHCYVSKNIHVKVTRHSPYYSDHSALCIEFRPVGSDEQGLFFYKLLHSIFNLVPLRLFCTPQQVSNFPPHVTLGQFRFFFCHDQHYILSIFIISYPMYYQLSIVNMVGFTNNISNFKYV